MEKNDEYINKCIRKYLWMRKVIGLVGMLFPIAIFLIGLGVGIEPRNSISSYYHAPIVGDLFIIFLSIITFFLFFYAGYEPKEDKISTFGALVCLGVIICPTNPDVIDYKNLKVSIISKFINTSILHGICAAALFIVLIIFCFNFLKTDNKIKNEIGLSKKNRNIIFMSCAWVMIICILTIFFNFIYEKFIGYELIERLVFVCEMIALFSFGISWSIKGRIDSDIFKLFGVMRG